MSFLTLKLEGLGVYFPLGALVSLSVTILIRSFGLANQPKRMTPVGQIGEEVNFIKFDYNRLAEYKGLLKRIHEYTKNKKVLTHQEQYRLLAINPQELQLFVFAVAEYYHCLGLKHEAKYVLSGNDKSLSEL